MELSTSQQVALDGIFQRIERRQPIVLLTGYAGTGKTTTMKKVVEHYPDATLCAPTHKASAVLSKATGKKVHTVCSVTSIYEGEVTSFEEEIKREADKLRRQMARFAAPVRHTNTGEMSFAKKEANHQLIICDEASMLSLSDAQALSGSCRTLVLLGDPGQLAPVNRVSYIHSVAPDFTLTEIHRNAGPIAQLANLIRANLPAPQELWQMVRAGCDHSYQFIALRNKTCEMVNDLVRAAKGYPIDHRVMAGEPLILTEPYRDAKYREGGNDLTTTLPKNTLLHVVHSDGERAFVTTPEGRRPNTEYQINLRDAWFKYGYCITAHRAQGSEFEKLCVIDEYETAKYMANKNGLNGTVEAQRWIYTAMTRAKAELRLLDARVIPAAHRLLKK